MKKKFVIGIDGSGVDEALNGLQDMKLWLEQKSDELAKKLADKGYETAKVIISNHIFSGETMSGLKVEKISDSHYVLKAESGAILFLEFGAGLIGYGHPDPHGNGPGTYPGKGHWDDPNGWWFETDDPRLIRKVGKDGKTYGHSYGIAPAMPMYTALKDVENDIMNIAREVFA